MSGFVNMVANPGGPEKEVNFFNRYTTVSLSTITLLHGVVQDT